MWFLKQWKWMWKEGLISDENNYTRWNQDVNGSFCVDHYHLTYPNYEQLEYWPYYMLCDLQLLFRSTGGPKLGNQSIIIRLSNLKKNTTFFRHIRLTTTFWNKYFYIPEFVRKQYASIPKILYYQILLTSSCVVVCRRGCVTPVWGP